MNFKFFIILVLISGFTSIVFTQTVSAEKEFSPQEIYEMKNKAVLITMSEGTFMIELFPEDAPNTVKNFLNLVESGYYDGIVFHRILPGFVIQAGDPNTKDPEADRSSWGQGGPGYTIKEEFNTLQHDRGIVSMARSDHKDSAGSQFFIMHNDASFLDGKYTAFGRLVPGTHSLNTLDGIVSLETDARDVPLDASKARIIKASILDPFSASGFGEPDRNQSIIKETKVTGGITENYTNTIHKVKFDIPYRWILDERSGNPAESVNAELDLLLEPGPLEHNAQVQIAESGFIPQIMILSETRIPSQESADVSTAYFSIAGGDDPKIISNYIFENDAGRKAHMIVTTQNYTTETETTKFKILQLHFTNSDKSYSIIYLNVIDWFRYEVGAFHQTVVNFEAEFDGIIQPINFGDDPVFLQILSDTRAEFGQEEEQQPLARIGGCLIATASYGSELAPQVQQLRELRDNTVLQTKSGSVFMTAFNQFYYSFSPMIADYERENPVFKEAVKLTITPLLASLTLLQYVDIDSEYDMLGYGIGVILLNIGMYFVAPAVLITKIRSFYKLQ